MVVLKIRKVSWHQGTSYAQRGSKERGPVGIVSKTWLKNVYCMYIIISLAVIKNEILPLVIIWLNFEDIMLCEII